MIVFTSIVVVTVTTASLSGAIVGTETPTLQDRSEEQAGAGTGDLEIDDLPMAWYLLSADEQRQVIHDATQAEIERCMSAAGFTYVPIVRVPDVDFLGKRYGVDPSTAAEIGFGSLDPDNDDAVLDPNTYNNADNPAYLTALFGDEETLVASDDTTLPILFAINNGCVGDAQREVYGDVETMIEFNELDYLVQTIDGDSYREALGSDDVVGALDEWTTCLADRGFAYESRNALLMEDWPEPRPNEREIAVAVADAECLEQVEYQDTMIRNEIVFQQRRLDESPRLVEEFRQLRDIVLERAADLG